MEIKNRLFPYPVLCEENDDYVDCSFNIKTEVKEELIAPVDGLVFFAHNEPLTYADTAVIKLIVEEE